MQRRSTALIVGLLLTGCSAQQWYASGRNAQRVECLKLADQAAQERCLKDANTGYGAYKKQADAPRQ